MQTCCADLHQSLGTGDLALVEPADTFQQTRTPDGRRRGSERFLYRLASRQRRRPITIRRAALALTRRIVVIAVEGPQIRLRARLARRVASIAVAIATDRRDGLMIGGSHGTRSRDPFSQRLARRGIRGIGFAICGRPGSEAPQLVVKVLRLPRETFLAGRDLRAKRGDRLPLVVDLDLKRAEIRLLSDTGRIGRAFLERLDGCFELREFRRFRIARRLQVREAVFERHALHVFVADVGGRRRKRRFSLRERQRQPLELRIAIAFAGRRFGFAIRSL